MDASLSRTTDTEHELLTLEPIADVPEIGRWLSAMEDRRRDTCALSLARFRSREAYSPTSAYADVVACPTPLPLSASRRFGKPSERFERRL